MRTTAEYVELIVPEHVGKPNFEATVTLSVDPLARMQQALAALSGDFDLDGAVGVQLDAVGVRVGRSRDIAIPLQGLYFTWGDSSLGWGLGVWKGPFDVGFGISQLGDDDYRRLLRAKILANNWDGTIAGAQAILDVFFDDPETFVFIEDDSACAFPNIFFTWGDPQAGWSVGRWRGPDIVLPNVPAVDMAWKIGVSGKRPSMLYLALLGEGYIPVKPVGVRLTYDVTSVNKAPLFGWGVNNNYVGGWGAGAWAGSPFDPPANTVSPALGQLDLSIPGNPLIALL